MVSPPRLDVLNVTLPPLHLPDAIARIADSDERAKVWTLVLDDDPTGPQTVRDVPVVMASWREEDLRWAAGLPATATVVLTNSRSLEAADAAAAVTEVVERATKVAADLGLRLRILTRSDSTLRGHFTAEVSAAATALAAAGRPVDGIVYAPCFLEAGRYTIDDVQWVARAGQMVPAAHTEFARDATFGYTELDLRDFVAARLPAGSSPVQSLSLSLLRGGPDGVSQVLGGLSGGQVAVANAADDADLEVLMLAIQQAEKTGRHLLLRTGPSFVRLVAGQPVQPPLSAQELANEAVSAPHGLVAVGSHTGLTNAQLVAAQAARGLEIVELAVPNILDPTARDTEIRRCVDELTTALSRTDTVLRTSRVVVRGERLEQLDISRRISAAVCEVVGRVIRRGRPRFLIAKGGITSSDVATVALGTRRAMVTGQMFPGQISAWRLIDGIGAGLPYVVFPGNVGTDGALTQCIERLGTQ